MTTALVPMSDIEKMGTAIAKSGLFGMKTPDQAIALMLIAQAEGMHPAIAARDYHVIQGRPALKADAMLARFQQAGGKVNWKVYTDEEVTGIFSHPAGGEITLTWTLAQAKKIGLANKDNWKNYPRAMLRARVISEGIRTVYPSCVVGVYSPEEVQDFDTPKRSAPKDMGAADVVEIESNVVTVTSSDADTITTSTLEIQPDAEQWVLNIPGKEPHVYFAREDWIAGFMELVERLAKSSLDEKGKNAKLTELKAANTEAFKKIGLVESANIYRDVASIIGRSEAGKTEAKKFIQEFQEEFSKDKISKS